MNAPETNPNSPFIIISTTLPSRDEAQQMARTLVERQLAACVHVIGPVSSVYRWKGSVESAEEWTCQAKTRRHWFAKVCQAITEAHSYEVPEIVAISIEHISTPYQEWLDQQL